MRCQYLLTFVVAAVYKSHRILIVESFLLFGINCNVRQLYMSNNVKVRYIILICPIITATSDKVHHFYLIDRI